MTKLIFSIYISLASLSLSLSLSLSMLSPNDWKARLLRTFLFVVQGFLFVLVLVSAQQAHSDTLSFYFPSAGERAVAGWILTGVLLVAAVSVYLMYHHLDVQREALETKDDGFKDPYQSSPPYLDTTESAVIGHISNTLVPSNINLENTRQRKPWSGADTYASGSSSTPSPAPSSTDTELRVNW